jgi:hypothetical protein
VFHKKGMANVDTKYLVIGRDKSYFVKHHSDSTKTFSETNIFNMLELLIYNIFVMFGGRVFFRMRQSSYRCFSRKTKRS